MHRVPLSVGDDWLCLAQAPSSRPLQEQCSGRRRGPRRASGQVGRHMQRAGVYSARDRVDAYAFDVAVRVATTIKYQYMRTEFSTQQPSSSSAKIYTNSTHLPCTRTVVVLVVQLASRAGTRHAT